MGLSRDHLSQTCLPMSTDLNSGLDSVDKDDPLGKLVEFSNRFVSAAAVAATSTPSGTPGSGLLPTQTETPSMSSLFDVAAHNPFMSYQPFPQYSTPWATGATAPTSSSHAALSPVQSGSPGLWWPALANCDPAWLAYSNPSSSAAAAAAAVAATTTEHSSALPSVYGSSYLGGSFSTLPAAGLLPIGNASALASPVGTPNANVTGPGDVGRGKAPTRSAGGKASSKTTCECPNCVDTRRIGLANMPKNKQGIHNCHIPGCMKIYKKSSHLKAHLRWHSSERPVKKHTMTLKK